ncbi:hypothetical protein ELQ90_07995 [Labedella phragmitis]|uniref:Uncharacterized protein n=1 Tax=Labedella phragmitis TaxID=2498849 RepID=A0A444PVV2_9MICO|nr:hypothetical protein [Labedella phragmitis]RWZ51999.1 hypothetical protein ELQ90_07995 [Labedella phragmitis]
MSDRAFSRRRPRWLVWLPSMVILVLIAAAGVLAWQVSSGSIGRAAPPEVSEAVTTDGFSRFSDDGIAYIRDSLQARIDLSETEPDAAELGLPADGDTVVESNDFSMSVGLYVGEESIRIPSATITLTTEDGRLVALDLAVSAQGYQEQSALLAQVAERFGMDPASLVDLDENVAQDVRDEAATEYAVGPGAGFGRPATATVAVLGGDGTALSLRIDFSS